MSETLRIAVQDASRTAEARRVARKMASSMGLDENGAERVSICVTELCTNLVKHASEGEILLKTMRNGVDALDVLALDRGPGMGDIEQCLRDGFSTGGSAGEGLGAIVRQSSASDFYSVAGKGTAVLARWEISKPSAPPALSLRTQFRFGVVNVCKPGQEVCGDSWGAEVSNGDTVVLVADGLGHGPEAQAASLEAVRVLKMNPSLAPQELVERIHLALRSSRGAAVAVARINPERGTVDFAGLGNIAAQIYSGAKMQQHLVSVNGTAGHQMHKLRSFRYPWPADGILILHSDGLSTSTNLQNYAGLALRDPALIAGVLYRDFARGNDDATVVVVKAH